MELRLKQYSTDKNVEDVNTKDVRSIVGYINNNSKEIKKQRIKEAIYMFNIGVTMVRQDESLTTKEGKVSIREMGSIIGMNYVSISVAKGIARKFDCDTDKFLKEYKSTKSVSWDQFVGRHRTKKKTLMPKMTTKMIEKIDALLAAIKKENADQDAITTMKRLRDNITKVIPLSDEILEMNYIIYYPCCGCGEDRPPAEGYELKQDSTNDHIKYPMCEQCIKDGVEPNYKRIALMYATQCINMDRTYNHLMGD